jgi:hypothetical protein
MIAGISLVLTGMATPTIAESLNSTDKSTSTVKSSKSALTFAGHAAKPSIEPIAAPSAA